MATSRQRIPFWRTLGGAHESIIANPGAAIRAFLPMLAFYCAIVAGLNWFHFPLDGHTLVDTAFEVAEGVIAIPLAAFAAVKWHRLILLGEQSSLFASPVTPAVFAKYLVAATLVWASASLPTYALMQGTSAAIAYSAKAILGLSAVAEPNFGDDKIQQPGQGEQEQSAEPEKTEAVSVGASGLGLRLWLSSVGFAVGWVVLLLPVLAVLSFIPLRLSLALPAVATGNLHNPLTRAWRLSRGNFWRLYWGSLLTMTFAIVGSIATIWVDDTARPGFIIANTLISGLLFAATLIWVGFLSHAYKALTVDAA